MLPIVFAAGATSVPVPTQQTTNSGATSTLQAARLPEGFTEKSARVNGVRINYKSGGKGPVVVLLTVIPKRVTCGYR